MPENFNFVSDNKIDIRHIRNEAVALRFETERKNHTVMFHVIYAVIAALCVYLAMSSTVPVISLLGMFFGPSMLVYTFIYSPLPIKIVSFLLPIVIDSSVLLITSKAHYSVFVSHAFTFMLCILAASLLTKAVLSGYGKTTCFVMVTAAYLLVLLCIGVFLLISRFGTFSPALAVETLDKYFDAFIASAVEYASSPLGLEAFRLSLQNYSALTDEEIVSSVKNILEATIPAIKLILPSIAVVSCMILSFFTISAFSFVAKKMKINVFVCIMDDFWTYRPSPVTAAMYDIVFFLYIIATFTELPQNISSTIVNLLLILTPAMFVVGINGIYSFFSKKGISPAVCKIICAVIAFAAFSFTGFLGILIISSFGVMFVTAKDREEKQILPLKLLEQKKLCDELCGKKESNAINSDTDNQKDGGSLE